MILPRRSFVALFGSALLAPQGLRADDQQSSEFPLVDQVPPMLDHILLGAQTLEVGIAFVEHFTGVQAAFGGVHPGRGTRNALLSLGTRRYLEIIAPDPAQSAGTSPLLDHLKKITEPKLVGWAAHPRNIQALAAQIKSSGIAAEGPTPGSRKRPDGKELHWQTLNLQDDSHGLLPFFIEWAAGSLHPSEDAPQGCQLLRFDLLAPDPAALAQLAAKLSLDVPIAKSASAQLHAVIRGAKGTLEVTS